MVTTLEIDADRALFEGKIQGLIVTCYADERPLQGLVGLLDWRFQGFLSHCLHEGVISGKAGECTYIPITRAQRMYHLFLIGAGHKPSPKQGRSPLPAETLKSLQKNLSSLGIQQIGISKSDFGNVTEDFLAKNIKGVSLCVVP